MVLLASPVWRVGLFWGVGFGPCVGVRGTVCAGWGATPDFSVSENPAVGDLWGRRGVWKAGAGRDDRGRCRENVAEKTFVGMARACRGKSSGLSLSFLCCPMGIFTVIRIRRVWCLRGLRCFSNLHSVWQLLFAVAVWIWKWCLTSVANSRAELNSVSIQGLMAA